MEESKFNEDHVDSQFQDSDYAFVRFRVNFDTAYGQTIKIVGDKPELGSWDPLKAIPLETNTDIFPTWVNRKRIKFKKGVNIDYKYLIFDESGNYSYEYLPAEENRHIIINISGKVSVKNAVVFEVLLVLIKILCFKL